MFEQGETKSTMWCEEEHPEGPHNSGAAGMAERDEQARKDRMEELAKLNALETAQVDAYATEYLRSFEAAFQAALDQGEQVGKEDTNSTTTSTG